MGAMSDAIFQIVEADKDLIVAYLRGKGLSAAQIRVKLARYFKQHCRYLNICSSLHLLKECVSQVA